MIKPFKIVKSLCKKLESKCKGYFAVYNFLRKYITYVKKYKIVHSNRINMELIDRSDDYSGFIAY